jgi:hypothetical protein
MRGIALSFGVLWHALLLLLERWMVEAEKGVEVVQRVGEGILQWRYLGTCISEQKLSLVPQKRLKS